jgi:hypothetical protein
MGNYGKCARCDKPRAYKTGSYCKYHHNEYYQKYMKEKVFDDPAKYELHKMRCSLSRGNSFTKWLYPRIPWTEGRNWRCVHGSIKLLSPSNENAPLVQNE